MINNLIITDDGIQWLKLEQERIRELGPPYEAHPTIDQLIATAEFHRQRYETLRDILADLPEDCDRCVHVGKCPGDNRCHDGCAEWLDRQVAERMA